MAKLIDGRKIAQEINAAVKNEIRKLCPSSGAPLKLASLMIGRSEDAQIFLNMQKKAAESVGIEFSPHELDENISQGAFIGKIKELNADDTVTAIIVQKPLPEGMDHGKVASSIAPEKDAEGVHPCNLGKIFRREADIVPCTPGAVMKILRVHDIDLDGKEVVIVGHSAIVGKPLSLMMLNEMATTTVCHIGTAESGNLQEHARRADILVVAVGKAEMVRSDWVAEGAVVIDVGINKVNGGIVGDVNFSEVAERASAITPVPGGVGPVTVSILMRNVLRAYVDQNPGS